MGKLVAVENLKYGMSRAELETSDFWYNGRTYAAGDFLLSGRYVGMSLCRHKDCCRAQLHPLYDSLLKWQSIIDGTGEDKLRLNCPLCAYNKECRTCIIYISTLRIVEERLGSPKLAKPIFMREDEYMEHFAAQCRGIGYLLWSGACKTFPRMINSDPDDGGRERRIITANIVFRNLETIYTAASEVTA